MVLFRSALGTLISLFLAGTLVADLSREAPPEYRELLAPLLTPVDEVLAQKDPFQDDDSGGTVLLSERITYLHPDGRRLRVRHLVFKARTEQGAKALASDTHGFSKRLVTPHLILARTIAPDGTRKPVDAEGAFLQRARGDSSSRLYDDREEVVLIFPDIGPGAVTETILVMEDKEPRFGAEYSHASYWTAGWPIVDRRTVLDLPVELAERLREHKIGTVVAKRSELKAPAGRVRLQWRQEKITGTPREPSRAPAAQVGPATRVSTWKDWDAFAKWYAGELVGRDDLSEELRKQVAVWTKGLEDPAAILDALFRQVANEVRYTGLEFGRAALQPYDCNLVWKRQFGDCKDKANLLAAMLRQCGIEARIALVNSGHAGVIHRESPSPYQFDHAIAVINLGGKGEKEKLVFCDPTISYGRPGVLAPSSADRDVLVIDEDKARWVRSPEQDAGLLDYTFDLALDSTGRISGWMTVRVRGYYAAGYAARYDGIALDPARSRLTELVNNFYEGAEVVDVELPDFENKNPEEVVLKAFFTTPQQEPDSEGRLALKFPLPRFLVQNFGEGRGRVSPFFQWRDEVRVQSSIKLQEQWSPTGVPKPLKLETDPYGVEAGWTFEEKESACQSRLIIQCRQALVPPTQVAGAAQANRSFYQWAEVPLLVTRGGKGVAPGPAGAVEMPLMPSGSGQLELVDRWFPLGSDDKKRRLALQDVIRFFPNDADTVFDANLRLAYLHYFRDEYEPALKAYTKLSTQRPGGVDSENFAIARYMQALSLEELERVEEALPILVELLNDGDLSHHRRGWSGAVAGEWARANDPKEALPYLRKALEFEGGFHRKALSNLVAALVALGEPGEAAQAILDHFPSDEEEGETLEADLIEAVRPAGVGASVALAKAFAEALAGLGENDPRRGPIQQCGQQAKALANAAQALPRIRGEVLALLESYQGEYFKKASVREDLESREAFEEHLDAVHDKKNDDWLAHAPPYFRRFEPGDRFTEILWQLLNYLKWRENPQAEGDLLFTRLSKICEGIPRSDPYYWDSSFTTAQWLEARGRWDGAEKIYAGMPGDLQFDEEFAHAAWSRWAVALEHLGRWERAIECHLNFADVRLQYKNVPPYLLRAGVLQAARGEYDDALATWALLRDVAKVDYEETEWELQIEEAISLSENPEEAKKLWERTEKWYREAFLPLCSAPGFELREQPPLALSQSELTDLDARLKTALAEKDKAAALADAHTLAIPGRILPTSLGTIHSLIYAYLSPLHGTAGQKWLECLLGYTTALEGEAGNAASLRAARRLRPALLLDLGKKDEALVILRAELPLVNREEDAAHYEAVISLHALCALRTGLDQELALRHNRTLCEGELHHLDRGLAVRRTVALLRSLDRAPEALVFLENQLKRADVAAEARLKGELTAQRENLRQGIEGGKEFRGAVRDWITAHEPPWFDHVEPREFGDDELEELRQVLEGQSVDRHELEVFKLQILGAQSEGIAPASAESAFLQAVGSYAEWTNSARRYESVVLGILNEQRFSEAMRGNFAWRHAGIMAFVGHPRGVRQIVENPVWELLRDRMQEQGGKELLLTAEAIQSGEPGRMVAAIKTIGGSGSLDSVGLASIKALYAALNMQGAQDAMKEVRALVGTWKFAPDSGAKPLALRLQWSRDARSTRSAAALHRRMAAEFLPLLQEHAKKVDPQWKERLAFESLDDLPREQEEAYAAARLVHGRYGARVDSRAWLSETELWLEEDGVVVPDRLKKALAIVLEEASSDAGRALGIAQLALREVDDEVRKELEVLLKPWRNAKKHPLSYCAVRSFEILGQEPGARIDLVGFDEAIKRGDVFPAFPAVLRARFQFANGDLEALGTFLETLDVEVLTDDLLVSDVLLYYELLEQEGELEVIREIAEGVLQKHVLDSWNRFEMRSVTDACHLASRLGKPALLPKPWRAHVLKMAAEDNLERNQVEAMIALVERDWAALEKAAREYFTLEDHEEEDPEVSFLLGLALHRQGMHKEALPLVERLGRTNPIEWAWLMDQRGLLRAVREALAAEAPAPTDGPEGRE